MDRRELMKKVSDMQTAIFKFEYEYIELQLDVPCYDNVNEMSDAELAVVLAELTDIWIQYIRHEKGYYELIHCNSI